MNAEIARVLVVDDNEAGRYVKTRVLQKAGWIVDHATDGQETLHYVESNPVDLIVLDVKLPDILGTEVCRQIKQRHEGILILQTSATFTEQEHRVSGLEAGADAYLTEPVDAPEFVATVRALLRVRAVERKLHSTDARLAAIVRSSPDAIIGLSREGRIEAWNEAAERLFGYSAAEAIGREAGLLVPPGSPDGPRGIFDRAILGESFTHETIRRQRDGALIPVQISAAPIYVDDEIAGVSVFMHDISDRKGREEHAQFLMREVAHRSKNLLAVIQSMARQTARHSKDLQEFHDNFGTRLRALASSQDLLVTKEWKGAEIKDILRTQVEPFAAAGQMDAQGPTVMLDPAATQNVGLALHELATNAAKYGALSVPSGKVVIRWTRKDGPEPIVRLSWQEQGGPAPRPPGKKGFGSAVIEQLAASALGGKAELAFLPEGASWTLDVPVRHILSVDGTTPPGAR